LKHQLVDARGDL